MDISLAFFAKKAVTQFQEIILRKRDDPGILALYFSAFSVASVNPCFQQGLHLSDFPRLIIEICQLHKMKGNMAVVNKGIQLLGNITVQNEEGKEIVWSLCYPEFLTEMLDSSHLCEPICFLAFNCLDDDNVKELFTSPLGIHFISQILFELTKSGSGDFCQLLLSRILLDFGGAVKLYSLFVENRSFTPLLLLLDFLIQSNEFHIMSMHVTTHLEVCTHLVELLCSDFLVLKPIIFEAISLLLAGWVGEEHEVLLKAELFKSNLAILAVFSGFSELLLSLQSKGVILQECLTLLDALAIYSQPKLAPTSPIHPNIPPVTQSRLREFLYGIRQHAMQLVANMLYSNYNNVSLIYENKSLLILILNHCRADMLNPFLTQWTILAIRNLCLDGRMQLLIGELENLGLDSKDVMKQAGLEKNPDSNGTLYLKHN